VVLTRELTVFVRQGCHLCADMLRELEHLKPDLDFRYSVRDVDETPALALRYGDRVPVLAAGATELCWYFLDDGRLREYLQSG
jgi:hypothetical protein